jgi:transposase
MQYVGLDIHKKFTYGVIKDKEGNILGESKFDNGEEQFNEFLSNYDSKETKIVMESTGVWEWIYEYLDGQGYKVILANPVRTKAIASAKIKTDKIDASILADLLRANLIAESYVPPKEVRKLRELTRQRNTLVKGRTQISNKIHAILTQNGLTLPWTGLCKKAISWLVELSEERPHLKSYINLHKKFTEEIKMVDNEIINFAEQDEHAQLLQTVPGIGPRRATELLSEIGEWDRFSDGRRLCCYAGLVPSVRQSGSTLKFGGLIKQANKSIKYILIETSWNLVRTKETNPLQEFYKKLEKKKGKQRAICATARKLCCVIYAMLRKQQTFMLL